jgi:hypothetical protein
MSLKFNKCSRTKWEHSEDVIPRKSWESSRWHHDAKVFSLVRFHRALKISGCFGAKAKPSSTFSEENVVGKISTR